MQTIHEAGCEAAVHGRNSISNEENRNTLFLIDAENILNSVNSEAFIQNVIKLCSGPILESMDMCVFFQKKTKKCFKKGKKGKITENVGKMYKIWDYFGKGRLLEKALLLLLQLFQIAIPVLDYFLLEVLN